MRARQLKALTTSPQSSFRRFRATTGVSARAPAEMGKLSPDFPRFPPISLAADSPAVEPNHAPGTIGTVGHGEAGPPQKHSGT